MSVTDPKPQLQRYDLSSALLPLLDQHEQAHPHDGVGGLPMIVATQLLNSSGALAVQTDLNGRILAASDNTSTMLEYSHEDLLQCKLEDFIFEQDREAFRQTLQAAGHDGEAISPTLQFAKAMTGYMWLQLRVATQQSADGSAPFLVIFGHDVTEWKRIQERLTQRMLRDPLTGLGNRFMMRDQMRVAIEQAKDNHGSIAVALLDLDAFKKVNDSLGHDIGDQLLCSVSRRLAGALRVSDSVARLGGDEFVILMPGVKTEKEAGFVAERLLAAVQQPVSLAGRVLHGSTSIGLALYPQHGTDETALLRHAESAMYRAKDDGKNTWRLYSNEFGKAKTQALSVELGMFEAIQNGEFTLHYQPICDTRTQAVLAVESLMRWTHGGVFVSPVEFIPMAEQNGLIHVLGSWALRTAAMQLARWDQCGMTLEYLTVNVSPVQFLHPAFSSNVEKALADSGIAPNRLVLEITEGALMRDPRKAEAILAELEAVGVRFAIDDFGTGYSNLGNLKRFPLTCLKIDRSFVKDTPASADDCAIVSVVLALAKELGLAAVAEGVETEEQRQFLASKGCELIQGWLVSKALPPEVLEQQINTGKLRLRATPQEKAVAG